MGVTVPASPRGRQTAVWAASPSQRPDRERGQVGRKVGGPRGGTAPAPPWLLSSPAGTTPYVRSARVRIHGLLPTRRRTARGTRCCTSSRRTGVRGWTGQSLTSRPRAGSGLGPPAAHRARLQARHSVRLKALVRLEQRHAQARSLPCPGCDLGPGELYSPDGPDLCDLPVVLLLSDKPERGDIVGRGRRAGGDTGAQSRTNRWKVKLRQVLDRSGFPQSVVRWSPRARRGLTWPPQPRPPSGTVACAAPSLLTVDAGGWGLARRVTEPRNRAG